MRRGVVAPVAVVAAAVLTGGWLLQRGVDRTENVYMKVHLLQEVVDRVESSYVDEVDQSSLYHSAIDGLIDDLHDPYSSFMEASDFENLRIQGIEGDYGGVGLEVIERDGMVTVVSPIPGTPGARAGIRAGDQFWQIDGQPADTMSVDDAVALLRGKPGTSIDVEMRRPGLDDPVPFTLTREVIQLKAALQGAGMKSLIVDLRGNPGGLLDQGIAVSDLFLDKGRSIVETRGRAADQNAVYKARDDDRYAGVPMIVLVDGGSASASEIVAGALQDNDRALLVGSSTFGKGLVQSL